MCQGRRNRPDPLQARVRAHTSTSVLSLLTPMLFPLVLPSSIANIQANSGDLVLAIRELEHPRFRRVGAHLHIDVYLTLEEALLGWARDLEHLDGEILSFSHSDLHKQLQDARKLGSGLDQGDPIVTPMGAALRWRAKGLPQGSNRSGRGDLLVHFKVQLPELTSEQADRLRSLLA